MKKRKMNNYLSPREKQILSVEKSISINIVAVSILVHTGRLTLDNHKANLDARLKEVQQKYGWPLLREVIPSIIKRMSENPIATLRVEGRDQKVRLLYEYLKEYLNK